MARLSSFVALLALAFLAPTMPIEAQQQWIEHRPPGAGYRIEFPDNPTIRTQDVPTQAGPIRMYMSEAQGSANIVFLSIYAVYPPGTLGTDSQASLDAARNGGVQNVKGTLREEKRLSIGGVPARRIVVDIPESNQVGIALIVLSGNQIYQAISVMPAGQESAPDVQRFLDSFALVSR